MSADASRALDAEVAEQVMGWTRGRSYGNGNGAWLIPGKENDKYPLGWNQTPRFSSDIAAAWQVVEKMRGGFSRWMRFAEALRAEVSKPLAHGELVDHSFVWRVCTPEHICRAALAAVRPEVPR